LVVDIPTTLLAETRVFHVQDAHQPEGLSMCGRVRHSSWRPNAASTSSIGATACTSPHSMRGNQMPTPCNTARTRSPKTPKAFVYTKQGKRGRHGRTWLICSHKHANASQRRPHRSSSTLRHDATPNLAQPHCRCALHRSTLFASSRINTRYPPAMRPSAQCHAVDPSGEMHRLRLPGKLRSISQQTMRHVW
jgi:hypothetical protein